MRNEWNIIQYGTKVCFVRKTEREELILNSRLHLQHLIFEFLLFSLANKFSAGRFRFKANTLHSFVIQRHLQSFKQVIRQQIIMATATTYTTRQAVRSANDFLFDIGKHFSH